MMKATLTAIDIMDQTNKFWRDSLKDCGVSDEIVNSIYEAAEFAVKYFRKKYI